MNYRRWRSFWFCFDFREKKEKGKEGSSMCKKKKCFSVNVPAEMSAGSPCVRLHCSCFPPGSLHSQVLQPLGFRRCDDIPVSAFPASTTPERISAPWNSCVSSCSLPKCADDKG